MTWVIPSTSIPRAATSVATSASTSPRSKRARARSRWPWLLSPCIATASHLVFAQALDQPVGAALGADEDERAAALLAAQLLDQVVELGALRVDVEEAVLDVGLRPPRWPPWVWRRGVAGVGGGDLAGRALQGRREEERLALVRGLGDDPVDRRA